MRRAKPGVRPPAHQAESQVGTHAWPSGRPTCAGVWELTAYTNDDVANTGHFSGELHRPIGITLAGCLLRSLSHLLPN